MRYYTVPVSVDRTGTAFAVTGAPGVVAGPLPAKAPRAPYGVSVPDGHLSSAAEEFLTASLTGAGEADRYLTPGKNLPPLSPTPYTTITVQQMSAIEETAAAGQGRPTARKSVSSRAWKPRTPSLNVESR